MNQTAALLSSMLPYDTLGLYEQTKPSLMYRVPRVVPDQKARFESDELFRRLSRESEVISIWFAFSAPIRFFVVENGGLVWLNLMLLYTIG